MKAQTALSIGIKLIAVLVAARAIIALPGMLIPGWQLWQYATEQGMSLPRSLIALSCSPSIAGALVAMLLFAFADRLARRLVSADERIQLDDLAEVEGQRRLLELGVRIIGAATVTWAVLWVVRQSVQLLDLSRLSISPRAAPWWLLLWCILVGLVTLRIGIYLLKGGPVLLRLAFGNAGTDKAVRLWFIAALCVLLGLAALAFWISGPGP